MHLTEVSSDYIAHSFEAGTPLARVLAPDAAHSSSVLPLYFFLCLLQLLPTSPSRRRHTSYTVSDLEVGSLQLSLCLQQADCALIDTGSCKNPTLSWSTLTACFISHRG